jgi:predicted MPP superfamily phosphohydrolase
MSGNVFFGAILAIYVSMISYMFARLCVMLAETGFTRVIVPAVFLLFSLSFPLSRIFSRVLPDSVTAFLFIIGSLYLAPMIYGFLLTLAADLLRILNYHVRLTANPPPYSISGRENMVAVIIALSIAISAAGGINARFPVAVTQYFESDGLGGYPAQLKIALLSDIHLGKLTGPDHLRKLFDIIKPSSPDIVLLAGDIIDDTVWLGSQNRRREAVSLFKSLEPRLGLWAVPGNHEYYVGIEECVRFLESCGVKVLMDEWAAPGGELLLIGRDDASSARFGKNRASLGQLKKDAAASLGSASARLPTIVLDHQPVNLEEAENAGVDLQLSGHTHRGQIFPMNFLIAGIFERHYGSYKKGRTNYYISSGAGTWGPPVRTIGRPEVVIINLIGRRGE